jgi:hypothetical protein
MGSGKDIIFSYAERDLRKRYSPSEGWEIQRAANGDAGVDYTIARKWQGVAQQIYASIVMKPELLQSDVDAFIAGIPAGARVNGKVLIVPAGADYSVVPDDIDTMELKGFVRDADKIVWWKRTLPVEEDAE